MTIRELIKAMEREDWALVAQRGDVRQFKHASGDTRRVTLAGPDNQQLAPGALAILGIPLR